MKQISILIDAHVHLHQCYSYANFLNNAKENFTANSDISDNSEIIGFLLLTESEGINEFQKLRDIAAAEKSLGHWNINLTTNSNTLQASNNNFKIYLVAGRQIITEEKLEVLSIGLEREFKDGKPVKDVIQYVIEAHAIPIIPWGFGKWTGSRGNIIKKLVLENKFNPFFLGDNGNRPWLFTFPSLIKAGIEKGILNLPGSDPLPFVREETKPGSFGFKIQDSINFDSPYDSLYKFITDAKSQYATYGKCESLIYFIKNQIAMQFLKRKR